MTESETPSADVLPDEDRFDFPESWSRFVRPRRGHGRPKPLKADPDAGRALLTELDARIRASLDYETNPRFKDPGLAFLAGEADVEGAAAVMAVVSRAQSPYHYSLRPLFDLIAADHGLPFAATALAEFLTLKADAPSYGSEIVELERMTLQDHLWGRIDRSSEFEAIASHLASLPDAEYAAVVDALAQRRTDPPRRLAVSLLVPDEAAWLDEVCAEHRAQQPNSAPSTLLLRVVGTASQLQDLDPNAPFLHWFNTNEVADLLYRLGAEAMPILERLVQLNNSTDQWKTVYRALAAVPVDGAFELILDRLDDPPAMGFALEAAARFPQRALRLIAARAAGADAAMRRRLTTLLYCDPIILGAALPLQERAVKDAIADLTGGAERVPAAPIEELPPLLASPPWAAQAAEAAPVVLKGLTPLPINRVVWAAGEREEWAEYEVSWYGHRNWVEMAKNFAEAGPYAQPDILAMAPPELTAELLPDWSPTAGSPKPGALKRILANHGTAAAEAVATAAGADASMRTVLLPIANLTAARLVADALVRLKTMRAFAFAWLDRHAADAAALLVPDALGKTKKPRAAAEAALRYIAGSAGADVVREAAAQYGAEAAAAVESLADVDPLTPAVAVPEPGAWVSAFALPQILLPGRERALPDAAVRTAATVLALGSPDYDYPGVAVLAETCDRASLTRFSLALFEQWLLAGAPWDESWALTQLMHFGDDEVVRELTPLIGRWPGENQHHRAVKGLRVLGAIGSEAALRAIQGIGEKAKFTAIKEEAREQITAIAANLGLSAEQLADRLVPDFGLREESALVLDYGPRQFKVGFDEQLKPFVTDADGKPRKSLPKPAAKDDALLAEAAYKRFANLRKELRTVAADQVKRLERAMVTGRSWTPAEFDEYFVRHPLTWHLTRRLVWTADDGAGPVAFRLAEDRTRTDVEENELDVAATAAIRVAHPVHLGESVPAWSEIFADYEIVQPFAQLGRPVDAFTDEELATGHLTRFEGASVSVGSLLGLVKQGWIRAGALDAGIVHGMWCELPGTGYLVLDLSPGLNAGDVNDSGDQDLVQVVISQSHMAGWTRAQATAGLAVGDPVAASEALTALAKAVEAAR
ncbi:DUF4132 domain-containing protein [Glycomyces albidus]|uniref:DUF4132 domain-containing protein n=1 Tax=Glycomyces albidus TaxID=2656774 RepID=A0A6L5GD92_9ACTN|nr:DUF4132 domain-containing protein [Glycomyces albidus]MQM27644.1 DUF4132 domain-containing protein [Glycomyces albidus]